MPTVSPPKRSRAVLIAILAVALVLVVACAVALFRSSHQVHRSIQFVQGIGEARMHLDALQRSMLEAETSQRGYLLTDVESLLTVCAEASHAVPGQIEALDRELSEDAAVRAVFGELRQVALAKLVNLRAVLDLAARGGRGEAASIVAAGSGRDLMDRFRTLATALDTQLADTESTIQAQLLRGARFRSRLLLVMLAANVVLVAAIVALSRQFARMRSVVRMVSRSPTIEHEGEWITFETYLDRRFGVKTSRGVTCADAEKLGWVRTPPGAPSSTRAHAACRRRSAGH